MHQAALELQRVVVGAAGVLLLAAAVSLVAGAVVRRWRVRAAARAIEPPVPALARFVDIETADADTFGGGARTARLRRRQDMVAYGYLAVAEEHVAEAHLGESHVAEQPPSLEPAGDESGATWCTLTVMLPGRVPFLVADHWQAVGRPGVPAAAPLRPRLNDAVFDGLYVIGVSDAETAQQVLRAAARRVLIEHPVQRLALRGSSLQLRTFDGEGWDDDRLAALCALAARFLASTPSFVRSALTVPGVPQRDDPLPEGRYGPDPA